MKKYMPILGLVILAFNACSDLRAAQFHDGDIIFQTSLSSQSVAIQKATRSQYSHMGIIFIQDGAPYVYEASSTVRYTPLKKWVARGIGSHYVVKRLQNANRILTPDAIVRLRQVAAQFKGKPYDLNFEWSDDRIYCSELVWKIYDRGLGLRFGKLQKLHEFDLAVPVVKTLLDKRYGPKIPMEETVISPGEMFSDAELTVVVKK